MKIRVPYLDKFVEKGKLMTNQSRISSSVPLLVIREIVEHRFDNGITNRICRYTFPLFLPSSTPIFPAQAQLDTFQAFCVETFVHLRYKRTVGRQFSLSITYRHNYGKFRESDGGIGRLEKKFFPSPLFFLAVLDERSRPAKSEKKRDGEN